MNATHTKRQAAITATVENETLSLAFANGKNLTLDAGRLGEEVLKAAMLHGLKQKLVDAAAISRNPETGRAASVEDKYEAVRTVYDRLLTGHWNAQREGAGAGGGLLLQALCRMYDGRKTAEQLREYLAGKTDAEKTALRKNPRIATIIEEIRAETGKAPSVDVDALLGELEQDDEGDEA